MSYISLNSENIENEHICCAFSDKKCTESYALKKEWMKIQFKNGFVFKRLDERAKVFIEYQPAEKAWIPVSAPNFMILGCFWVSGKYKGHGHGKALLQEVINDAKSQGKDGLVTVVGKKKFHFMSDGKWFLRQGFKESDTTAAGFSLLSLIWNKASATPQFNKEAKIGECPNKNAYAIYYSNRCPYTEYHVKESWAETAANRNIDFKVIKLDTLEKAQKSPSPATIFSLFKDGQFITTDISVCMDSRFDKIMGKR